MWWKPENFAQKRNNLLMRTRLIQAVRAYFDGRSFVEVETPILQVSPVMDTHIHAVKADIRGIDLKKEREMYLHTSPEFAMKKLLVAGMTDIYQICHVFRDAEGSRRHSPEFTMIEWYSAGKDYTHLMQDCVEMVRFCAKKLDIRMLRFDGCECDPFQTWQKLSVADAFYEYADLNLNAYLGDKDMFAKDVKEKLGLHVAADDDWDDIFFRVMAEKIEPHLGMDVPTFLYDYPASMASLSRKKPSDPRYAERFELYICGLEICNAFSELTDADEQRKRFVEEMTLKQRLYGEQYPIDEDFLAALEYGYPESAGNALGIDRLAMLFADVDDIQDILWMSV